MGSAVYTDVHEFWKHPASEPTLEAGTVPIHPLSAQQLLEPKVRGWSLRWRLGLGLRLGDDVKAFLLSRIPALPPQGSLSRPTVGTQ